MVQYNYFEPHVSHVNLFLLYIFLINGDFKNHTQAVNVCVCNVTLLILHNILSM